MVQVRCQILVSFQKPPKKVQPKFRQMPFGEGPWNAGVQRFANSIDDMLEEGDEGTNDYGGAHRPLTGKDSVGQNSVITLPGIRQQEGGGRGENTNEDGNVQFPGEASTQQQPPQTPEDNSQRPAKMPSIMVVEKAKSVFITPAQKILDNDAGGAGALAEDKFDDMKCICGKPAEFECSRCTSQGYCSSTYVWEHATHTCGLS